MKVTNAEWIEGTDRDVDCPRGGFNSRRLLLKSDGLGYTMTRTTVWAGKGPQTWHYKNHLETCYCIEGEGILINLETGEKFKILPGDAYVLDKHERHSFEAVKDTVLICVFNPPLKGREVHNKDGSYE